MCFYFICMSVGVHVCLFVCTMCQCPWRPGEGAGSPGSGVTVVVRNEPRSFARAAGPLNLWVICPGHSMFYLFILNASREGGCNSILGSDSPKVAFPWLLGAVKNWKGAWCHLQIVSKFTPFLSMLYLAQLASCPWLQCSSTFSNTEQYLIEPFEKH